MTIGSSAAKSGFKNEQKFTDLINGNQEFRRIITRCLNDLRLTEGTVTSAANLKDRGKTDVSLYINGGVELIGCSLKHQ